jgi:hypothetical protein
MSNVQCPPRVHFHVAFVLIAAVLVAGAGCSQGAGAHAGDTSAKRASSRAAPNGAMEEKGAEGVVSWSATLEDDAPVLAEFEQRAKAYGCATQHEGNGVLAKCGETPIMVVQKGRKVAVGCQRVSLEDCHALFEQIVSGAEDGGEGGGAEPASPPPGTTSI